MNTDFVADTVHTHTFMSALWPQCVLWFEQMKLEMNKCMYKRCEQKRARERVVVAVAVAAAERDDS